MQYDYKQYGATYGASLVLGQGNGLLYTITPTARVSLAQKKYDGLATVNLESATYQFTGAVGGDQVRVSVVDVANFTGINSSAVGANKHVEITGIEIEVANNGKSVYGYLLAETAVSAEIGIITPKAIVISNVASNTTYDAVTNYAGTMATAGYTHTALVGTDAIGSVTQTASIGGSAVTGIARAGTFISTPSGVVLSGGIADNYSLSYVGASNSVAKADLTIAAVASLTGNTYRGTAYTGTYTTTALGSDASSITVTGQATGINAGTYTSNLSASGSILNNYNTPTIINANLVISPAPLGIELTGTYAGTRTIAPSTFIVTGLLNGDVINSIVSANVSANGSNYVSSITGVAGTAVMGNYYITTSYNSTPNSNTTNMAIVTPANLVILAVNDAKFVTQVIALRMLIIVELTPHVLVGIWALPIMDL